MCKRSAHNQINYQSPPTLETENTNTNCSTMKLVKYILIHCAWFIVGWAIGMGVLIVAR